MSSYYTPRTSPSPVSSAISINEIQEEISPEDDTAIARATQEGRNPTEVITTISVSDMYWPLFDAIRKGNWNAVRRLVNEDGNALMATIMTIGDQETNVLEVAIATAQDELVEDVIALMPHGLPIFVKALCSAAKGGRMRIVEALLKGCPSVIPGINIALLTAILNAPKQKEVIWVLARRSSERPCQGIMTSLITAGHSDICLYLARRYPSLLMSKKIFHHLVGMAKLFRSGARLRFWSRCIYKCIPTRLIDTSQDNSEDTEMARALKWFGISLWKLATKSAHIKRMGELKLMHHSTLKLASAALDEMESHLTAPELLKYFWTIGELLMAVHWGISELVILCIERHPELLWNADFAKELMIATLEVRNVELFRLLDTQVVMRRSHVMEPSSLITAVVKRPPGFPRDIAGATFLLQRELQWFKMIEDMDSSLPSTDRKLNQDEFSEKHQDIIKEAKEWMKHTSSSCIILATLIITVTLAGAVTLPGGNNGSTGEAMFIKKSLFRVFAISNGLALLFSSCSTVMFMAILTSRYAIDDFLYSLPRKLILGLTCLFLSLAGILGAFGSAFVLLLRREFEWIDIPVILMGGFVLLLFTILQLPLFVDMVKSTFRPSLRSQ